MNDLESCRQTYSSNEVAETIRLLRDKKRYYYVYISAAVLAMLLALTIPWGLWVFRFVFEPPASSGNWLSIGFALLVAVLPTAGAVVACLTIAQAGDERNRAIDEEIEDLERRETRLRGDGLN